MTLKNLVTPISIDSRPFVTMDSHFITLGSCFSESIGNKLLENTWPGLANPFGTLFHPFALFKMLESNATLEESLFLEIDGLAYHYHLPKTFFATDRATLRQAFEAKKKALRETLDRPNTLLILTLGTSLLYSLNNQWVANCHQQPSSLFLKAMTSIDAMALAWESVLRDIPKHCQIIVTVSPVRHEKEGLVQSSLSKSQLRVLVDQMQRSAPDRVHYFPAFEIMMDELRDYRFYARDMLHPSDLAIDTIWERFLECYLDVGSKIFCKQWGRIRDKLDHRPLHPQSEAYRKFLSELLKELESIPDRPLEAEKQLVLARLREIE